jgi:hypothetical protein
VVQRVFLGVLSNRLSNTDSLACVFRRVQQMMAKEFSESPGVANQSNAIDEAPGECEKVEQLGAELEFLRKCHTRLFKTPPKEWIEERVSRIKEVL